MGLIQRKTAVRFDNVDASQKSLSLSFETSVSISITQWESNKNMYRKHWSIERRYTVKFNEQKGDSRCSGISAPLCSLLSCLDAIALTKNGWFESPFHFHPLKLNENISKCSRLNFIHVLCYFIALPGKHSAYLFTHWFVTLLVIFLSVDWSEGEQANEWVSTRSVRTWRFKYTVLSMYCVFHIFHVFRPNFSNMFWLNHFRFSSPNIRQPIAALVCGSTFAYGWALCLEQTKMDDESVQAFERSSTEQSRMFGGNI